MTITDRLWFLEGRWHALFLALAVVACAETETVYLDRDAGGDAAPVDIPIDTQGTPDQEVGGETRDADLVVDADTAYGGDIADTQEVVEPPGRVNLAVRLHYAGDEFLHEFIVYVLSSDPPLCEGWTGESTPSNTIAEMTFPSDMMSAHFWNLPDGSPFAVMAIAKNERGHVAAYGCLEGVLSLPNMENQVNVLLTPVPIEFTGHYAMQTRLQLRSIPPPIGRFFDRLVEKVFNFPQRLSQKILDRYCAERWCGVGWFGSITPPPLFTEVEGWVVAHTAPWYRRLVEAMDALSAAIRHVEIAGTLELSQDGPLTVLARETWQSIVIYGEPPCDAHERRERDDTCAHQVVPIDALAEYPWPPVSGGPDHVAWVGTRSPQGRRVTFAATEVPFNHGRFSRYVLDKVFVPEWTEGAHDELSQALRALVDCEALVREPSEERLEAMEIDAATLLGYCTAALEEIVGQIPDPLDELSAASNLRLSGEASLIGYDDTRIVQDIPDGQWEGTIEAPYETGHEEVQGEWRATRLDSGLEE